jgi:methylisocitrate lyase
MTMSLLTAGPLPVTAPLGLHPPMARVAEAAGFGAGSPGGGATGDPKVALEANLDPAEMCPAALDSRAVSSPPLIRDGACGIGIGALPAVERPTVETGMA